jgi:hypothetical protein
MWDAWKKGFDAWESATAQYMELVLKSPLVLWPAGMSDVLTLLADEHFAHLELEVLRQPNCLAAIVQEYLGGAVHLMPRINDVYGIVYATDSVVNALRVQAVEIVMAIVSYNVI